MYSKMKQARSIAMIFLSIFGCLCLLISVGEAQVATSEELLALWSDDGMKLAVVAPQQISIFSDETSDPVIIELDAPINNLIFSPSNALVAAGTFSSWDPHIQIWDSVTGEQIAQYRYEGGYGDMQAIRFSEDEQTLAFSYHDYREFLSGKLARFPLAESVKQTNSSVAPQAISASPSGVYLWGFRSTTAPTVTPITSHPYRPENVIAISPDLSSVLLLQYFSQLRTGYPILSMKVANLETTETLGDFADINYRVQMALYEPNAPRIALLADRGFVRFLNTETFTLEHDITFDEQGVYTIAYNADGSLLAAVEQNNSISIWEVETGDLIATYPNQPAAIHQLKFTHTDELIAFGDPLQYPQTWNAITLETRADFTAVAP